MGAEICLYEEVLMPDAAEEQDQAAREVAIDTLRAHQEECCKYLGLTPACSADQQLEQALTYSRQFQKTAKAAGEYLRIGCFKYPPELERLRWQRTEEVIRRVRPGLDAQTGSPDPKMLNLCDHVLLGTTRDVEVDSEAEPKAGYVLVLLRYGLIEFLYQAAKAVVLSWLPLRPKPGTSGGMGVSQADVDKVLQRDDSTLQLLSRSLHSFMFCGLPRPRCSDLL